MDASATDVRHADAMFESRPEPDGAAPQEDGALRRDIAFERAIIDANPIPSAISRLSDSVVLHANKRYLEVFGLTAEEVIGKPALDFYVDPADRARLSAALSPQGKVDNFETQLKRGDGTTFWVEIAATMMIYDGVPAIFGGFHNIEQRRRTEADVRTLNAELEARVCERTLQLQAELEQRAAAETALRDSEERFRLVAESAAEAIISIDSCGHITFWNNGAQRMYGYDPNETLGRHFLMLSPARHRETQQQLFDEVAGGNPDQMLGHLIEGKGRHKNGSEFPLEVSFAEWRVGEETNYTAIVRDISRRKTAERAAAEKNRLLETTFESISVGFVIFDADDKLIICNRNYRKFNDAISSIIVPGVAFEDLVRASIAANVDTYSGDSIDDKITRRMAQHRNPRHPIEVQLADQRWMLVSERRTADGGTSLVQTDITDRKIAEDQSQLAQVRLNDAIECLPASFFLFNADDRLVLHNPAVGRHFPNLTGQLLPGLTFAEFLDLNIRSGWFPDAHADPDAWRRRCLADHKSPPPYREYTLADGRTLQHIARKTTEGGTVGIWFDITERHRIETELLAAKERADQASRAKSEFLSRMSHELRTPMNAILGFGQLLAGETAGSLNPDQAGYVRQILSAGEHLLQLINEVLDLVKIESGKFELSIEVVDSAAVIEDCVNLARPLADKRNIDLKTPDVDPAAEAVSGNFTRLKQSLLNLISNAIKYNHEHGTVTTSVDAVDGAWARFTVADTGPGIAVEDQDRLFDAFSRSASHANVEGTGIGLTITKRFIELMGGRVGFESATGAGSRFWIDLPLSDDAAATGDKLRTRMPATATSDGRADHRPSDQLLLYVEDDPASLQLMAQVVARLPQLELLTAHTAEYALALAETRQPALVLMDVDLPGLDGAAMVRQLRRHPDTRDTGIIGLSANADTADTERLTEIGFDGYLAKPIKVADLTAEIRRRIG